MPANLHVVVGGEQLGEAVDESGEGGYGFESRIRFIGLELDLPEPDFVVLVSAVQLVAGHDQRFDSSVGGCNDFVGSIAGEIGVSGPGANLGVGGAGVKEFAVNKEGEDGRGVR